MTKKKAKVKKKRGKTKSTESNVMKLRSSGTRTAYLLTGPLPDGHGRLNLRSLLTGNHDPYEMTIYNSNDDAIGDAALRSEKYGFVPIGVLAVAIRAGQIVSRKKAKIETTVSKWIEEN